MQTIKLNPLIEHIILSPFEYWRLLLFKDAYNYGGIKETNPDIVTNRWDIALHLPEAIRKKFILTIGEFLLRVYKHN